MRTDTPVAVKLSNYKPYPFSIERVSLAFDLDPKQTVVRAELSVVPHGDGPMHLDGEALTLRRLRLNPTGEDSPDLDPGAYRVDADGLTLLTPPTQPFVLETTVEISPEDNKALSGLYMSGGRFCTQCEAVGFRRITYYPDRPDVMSAFTVWMSADAATYPILLSNGTPGASGDLDGGRHYATWEDPHKKPSYLFALCAGDYDIYSDQFTTASGRDVALNIHVDKGDAPRAAWAMDSLKRSMTWDEQAYGREYDLGVFNIVAVRDFNFGAMENKGLNIFNSAYVLADEDTATDADFEAIESIVAHEYFHNWTGNRITCRDWFQLCLKEGLTVFRDQSFSADMRSAPVQRIKDVIRLRARQFPEDAGPLSHAVRPVEYGSIDNLYTATVYEKGAEIIGMLKQMIGPDAYRKGMDLYFDRHDGQAVTIEDFYACFQQVTRFDFTPFLNWYSQPGTPDVTITEDWDAASAALTVTLRQRQPDTPGPSGGTEKQPLPIPLNLGFLSQDGGAVQADELGKDDALVMLIEREETHRFTFPTGTQRPFLSINRGFSAPVRIHRDLTNEAQMALARVETDPFNQWDGLQGLLTSEILAIAGGERKDADVALIGAVAAAVVAASGRDPAFAALLTRLPDVGELFLERSPADPVALAGARDRVQSALYDALRIHVTAVLETPIEGPFDPGAEQAGRRALRTAMIGLLAASDASDAGPRLLGLYGQASNMTEQLACLRALCKWGKGPKIEALEMFESQWGDNPLVMDKWFATQALTGDAGTIAQLSQHAAFTLDNPNRVRSVVGVFAMQNLAAFHAPDGSGYLAVEDLIRRADAANPALAARLLTAFEPWKKLEPHARGFAEASLKRLSDAGLSENAADIVARALG